MRAVGAILLWGETSPEAKTMESGIKEAGLIVVLVAIGVALYMFVDALVSSWQSTSKAAA